MPTDASIPLAAQTPQPYDPMAAYGRVLQLQNALQGQQLQQAQITGAQQENQMRAVQMDQMQKMNALYRGSFAPDGTVDIGRLSQAMAANGLGSKIPEVLKGVTEYQQSIANLGKTRLEVQNLEADALGGLGRTLQTANYDPQLFLTKAQMAIDAKAADPQNVQPQIQQVQQALLQDPAGATARQVVKGFADAAVQSSEKWQTIANSAKSAEGSYLRGQAAEQNADREQLKQDTQAAAVQLGQAPDQASYAAIWNKLPAGVARRFDAPEQWNAQTTPQKALNAGKTAHELAAEQQAATNAKNEQDYRTATLAEGAQRVGIEAANAATARDRLALEQSKQTFDQAAIQRTAQALAGGDLTRLKDVASLRGDQRLQIYDLAKQINPNFNTAEADRKIKNEDYYANGAGAQHLQSFGTFLEHAGSASDAVQTYRNTGSPLINKPLNWIKNNAAGDPAYQSFAASLEPVRKEFEGFLLGGRALYGDDRKAAETILSDNSSPAQIQAALKTMGHTALARFTEENYRYKKVSGHDLADPFSPEALEGAQKIGVNLSGGQSGGNPAPAGQPRPAPAANPNPAPKPTGAPGFKLTATDPSGHRIGSNDGRTWFDLQTGRKVQ
jgi:hypothetical protein